MFNHLKPADDSKFYVDILEGPHHERDPFYTPNCGPIGFGGSINDHLSFRPNSKWLDVIEVEIFPDDDDEDDH